MKKNYVKPMVFEENFEANEYVAACTIANDGIASGTYDCWEPFHREEVSFRPSSIPGFYRVYNKDGIFISEAHYETSTDSMVWITIKGPIAGTEATTTHHAKVKANHS